MPKTQVPSGDFWQDTLGFATVTFDSTLGDWEKISPFPRHRNKKWITRMKIEDLDFIPTPRTEGPLGRTIEEGTG